MRIEDLARWHWVVIGLLVGIPLGYMWTQREPPANLRSMDEAEFRRALTLVSLREPTAGLPFIRNVVVYPPRVDAYGRTIYQVTFEELHTEQGNRDATVYVRKTAYTGVPFDPVRADVAPENNVIDYLRAASREYDHIDYSVSLQYNPMVIYGVSITASVLLIGGVWPSVINLLVGAGLGRRSAVKEKVYDFDKMRAQSQAEEELLKPQKKLVTQQDRDQLEELTEKLEKSVGPVTSGAAGSTPSTPAPSSEIRELRGGPVEAPSETQTEQEAREYKGEFYPVARPSVKKD